MKPDWLADPVAPQDATTAIAAAEHQARLTKPEGSLGRLEKLAIHLAAMQGNTTPSLEQVWITLFAADHGVAAEKISPYPQTVTAEMISNFARGGAAISVLSRLLNARLEVINLGTVTDPGPLPGVISIPLGPGTANFVHETAMNEEQLATALQAGSDAVKRAISHHAHLFIGGEMGIANTTTAAALACALLNAPPRELVGPGSGLDATGIRHKITVIERALARHHGEQGSPYDILHRLGGFEIAALTGAYIRCAQQGVPALVDGYIASVAALMAAHLLPGSEEWFIYAHRSAEPGHRRILEALGAEPLLDLGLCLGEGSGAALALPLLRLACALHNEMATFAEAGIAEKHSGD